MDPTTAAMAAAYGYTGGPIPTTQFAHGLDAHGIDGQQPSDEVRHIMVQYP